MTSIRPRYHLHGDCNKQNPSTISKGALTGRQDPRVMILVNQGWRPNPQVDGVEADDFASIKQQNEHHRPIKKGMTNYLMINCQEFDKQSIKAELIASSCIWEFGIKL